MTTATAARPASPDQSAPTPPRWLVWGQVAVLLVLAVFIYHSIVASMVRDWLNDPNFSHGLFVPMFSGFVVWQRRASLRQLPLRPAAFGLVIIACALLVLLVG